MIIGIFLFICGLLLYSFFKPPVSIESKSSETKNMVFEDRLVYRAYITRRPLLPKGLHPIKARISRSSYEREAKQNG